MAVPDSALDTRDRLKRRPAFPPVAAKLLSLLSNPDADALDLQIQGADERSKKTYTFIEPISIEIFGTPNPATLETMKKIAGWGVAVKISPKQVQVAWIKLA